MNPVLEHAQYVAERSRDVQINPVAVEEFAANFLGEMPNNDAAISVVPYNHLTRKEQLHFLLLLCATNFCYWGDPKWTITYNGKDLGGQWGNAFCLLTAHKKGLLAFTGSALSTISREVTEQIYHANVAVPLVAERWRIFQEVGHGLINLQDNFQNLINASERDVLLFLHKLTQHFPSFHDSKTYQGRTVFFWKRAQLLAHCLHTSFLSSPEQFTNVNLLTGLGDYKVPAVLRKLGIFIYSSTLAQQVDSKQLIARNSAPEIELQANTIWVVELLRQAFAKQDHRYNASDITTMLWLKGKEQAPGDKPHHRTLTTDY